MMYMHIRTYVGVAHLQALHLQLLPSGPQLCSAQALGRSRSGLAFGPWRLSREHRCWWFGDVSRPVISHKYMRGNEHAAIATDFETNMSVPGYFYGESVYFAKNNLLRCERQEPQGRNWPWNFLVFFIFQKLWQFRWICSLFDLKRRPGNLDAYLSSRLRMPVSTKSEQVWKSGRGCRALKIPLGFRQHQGGSGNTKECCLKIDVAFRKGVHNYI